MSASECEGSEDSVSLQFKAERQSRVSEKKNTAAYTLLLTFPFPFFSLFLSLPLSIFFLVLTRVIIIVQCLHHGRHPTVIVLGQALPKIP